jgi:hypothetical protein
MSLRYALKSIQLAVRLKSGVWGTASSGFVLAGIGFLAARQHTLGWIALGLGAAMILWGLTIHGRNLWEPWWHGPIRPEVNAFLFDFPYQQDTVINGIKWDPDFSHVHVHIANRANETMSDLNFVIFLDRHIIRSACRAAFADCAIGPESRGIGQITLMGIDNDGKKVAITTDQTNSIDIAPRHRLICEKLASGAEIDIDLAIVTPLRPPAPKIWVRGNPTRINIEGTYSVRGLTQHVGWFQPLGKANERANVGSDGN